jgi:hypothetical protein
MRYIYISIDSGGLLLIGTDLLLFQVYVCGRGLGIKIYKKVILSEKNIVVGPNAKYGYT